MARVRPADLDDERAHLSDGAAAYEFYRLFTDERDIRCYRCAE
jgi:glycine cleavage system H protein